MSQADAPSTAVAVIDGKAELLQGRDGSPTRSLTLSVVPVAAAAPAARQLTPEQAQRELAVLESDLPLLAQRIARHTEGYKWSVLEYGLRLLKAQEIHRISNGWKRGEDGQFNGSIGPQGGFLEWLETKCPDLKRATAYNYLTAAENAGLTVESPLEAVAKLRAANALADRSIGDLYKRKAAPLANAKPGEGLSSEQRMQVEIDECRQAAKYIAEAWIEGKKFLTLPDTDEIKELDKLLLDARRAIAESLAEIEGGKGK